MESEEGIEQREKEGMVRAVTGALLRKKSLQEVLNEAGSVNLSKCLTAFDLTFLGVGTIIGAGIFVLTGVAARNYAGPAIMISYMITGMVCVFSGLCYAEFAARVPISGSAYTYAYTTVGEFIAWIIGWNLVLEYTIGAATVARGWSGYLVQILSVFSIPYPSFLYDIDFNANFYFFEYLFKFDITAAAAIFLYTIVLCIGVQESTRLNGVIVVITILIIIFVIISGLYLGDVNNWTPFFPYGFNGVFSATATIFFS